MNVTSQLEGSEHSWVGTTYIITFRLHPSAKYFAGECLAGERKNDHVTMVHLTWVISRPREYPSSDWQRW